MGLGGLFCGKDERVEGDERPRQLEEGVAQHLVCVRPLVHVYLQTLVQKVLENDGQLVPILDDRFAVCGNEIEGAQRVLVEIWRLSLNHLDGHDPQRPDVHLGPIVLSCHHLRRHPVGRADHGGPLVLLGADLGAKAKVSELDVAVHAKQDVVRLDVAVDHVTLGTLDI